MLQRRSSIAIWQSCWVSTRRSQSHSPASPHLRLSPLPAEQLANLKHLVGPSRRYLGGRRIVPVKPATWRRPRQVTSLDRLLRNFPARGISGDSLTTRSWLPRASVVNNKSGVRDHLLLTFYSTASIFLQNLYRRGFGTASNEGPARHTRYGDPEGVDH